MTAAESKQEVWISPLGMVSMSYGNVTSVRRTGAFFEVHRVLHEGRELAVKTPARPRMARRGDANEGAWQSTFSGIQTSLWGGQCDGLEPDEISDDVLHALLVVEAERIRQTRGAWNHDVVSLGFWDPDIHVRPDTIRNNTENNENASISSPPPTITQRGRLALVMPWHPGQTLVELPLDEQRRLFPVMLPALWDALCVMPHGDLSAANMILAPDRSRFVLIDPASYLCSQRGEDGPAGGWADVIDLVASNADGYALLPPFFDSIHQWGKSETKQLQQQQQQQQQQQRHAVFMDRLRELATVAGWATPLHAPPPHDAHGRNRARNQASPFASDVHALGVIYYRILTEGCHPFTRTSASPKPAWLGSYGEHGKDIQERLGAALTALETQGGFAPPSRFTQLAHSPPLMPEEDALALALLNLTVSSRQEIEALVQAIRAATTTTTTSNILDATRR